LVASCVGTGLLKHTIEWKIEGMTEGKRRRGRRFKCILEDIKENRAYWKLKETALDRTLCDRALEEAVELLKDIKMVYMTNKMLQIHNILLL
jgi:hypothetical protein